jgi:hypothetical protein
MTLTTWLTDYVFTPLRMAVRNWGNAGLVFSLFVNMVLIGIWHGFRWSFALFGAVHATYLSIDALTQRTRKRFFKTHAEAARWSKWIAPVFTFHLIAVAFVLFRGESLAQTRYVLTHLAQGLGAPTAAFATFVAASGHRVLIGLGGYLIMELADYASRHRQRQDFVRELPNWVRWSVYACTAVSGIFLVLILLASVAVPNPFLYAIF